MRVSDFLNKNLDKKDFLDSKYIEQNWNEILPGSSQGQLGNLLQAVQDHEYTIRSLLDKLSRAAASNGVVLDVHEDGTGNYVVSYLREEEKNLKPEEIRKKLSIPKYKFSFDDHGIGHKNGLKSINQNVMDIVDGELVMYTKNEQILLEELNKFSNVNSKFMKNLKKGVSGDDKAMLKAARSVSYTAKQIQNRIASAGDYKALSEEANQARQGTGSKQSLLVRRGYTDVRPMIQKMIKENKALAVQYKKQNGRAGMSYSKVQEEMEKDIMQLLTLYSQNRQFEDIQKQVAASPNNKFSYLLQNKQFKDLFLGKNGKNGIAQQVHGLHPYIGTSQENSVYNFLMSFVKNSDLSYMGGLDDASSRKRVQVSNTLSLNGVRKEAAQAKKDLTKKGVVFTKAQNSTGISAEDLETRMYGLMYATQEEISKAQRLAEEQVYQDWEKSLTEDARKALTQTQKEQQRAAIRARVGSMSGAHSGGIFYSKNVETSLDAMQERYRTLSKTDVSKRMEQLRKNKATKGLSEKDLQDRAIRELIAKDTLGGYKDADQVFIRDPKGSWERNVEDLGDSYSVLYRQAKHMASGNKLLTGSDYDRVTGQAIDPEVLVQLLMGRSDKFGYTPEIGDKRKWAQQFLNTNKISMLKNVDKLSYRNFSGVYENYLNSVFDYFRSQGKENPFAGNKNLSQWLTFDKTNGQYIVNQDLFNGNGKENQARLAELINTVNSQFADGHYLKDIFKLTGGDINKGIDVDWSKFIGYTSANQFNSYDYGAPGKTVSADYRWEGALRRGSAGASYGTGKDMSRLLAFKAGKQGYMIGDKDDQARRKEYEEAVKEERRLRELSFSTSKKDFAFNNSDLIMSYNPIGDRRGLILNDQNQLVYSDTGEKYEGSTKDNGVYLDLSHDYKKLTGEDYDKETGKVFKNSLGGTIYDAISQLSKFKKGQLYYRPGTEGGAYYTHNENGQISGTAVALQKYNPEDWKDENNPELVNIPAFFDQSFRGILAAEERYQDIINDQDTLNPNKEEIQDAKEQLMSEIGGLFAAQYDEVNNKNGSIFKKQKVRLGHSMMGQAGASEISNLDTDDYLKNLLDTTVLANNEDVKGLLQSAKYETSNEYNRVLMSYLQYMYGDQTEDAIKQWVKGYKSGDTSDANNKLLEDFVLKSITLDSDVFNWRKNNALKNGETLRGLGGEFARFPLSNGLDVKDVEVFAGNKEIIEKGKMRVGLGLGNSVNADFDGDKLVLHLDMAEAKALAAEGDISGLHLQKQAAVDFQKKISAAVGAVQLQSLLEDQKLENGNIGHMKDSEIRAMFNEQAQQSGAVASRLNKHYTGMLSNNYQGITETMAALTPGIIDPNSQSEKEAFLQQMMIRGVFEGFTQDAISSKKVTQRIAEQYGINPDEVPDNFTFLTDLNELMGLFKSPDTYKQSGGIKQAFSKAQEMGLMKENEAFSGRIAAQIFAYAQQLYTDKEGNLDTESMAKALHMDKDYIANNKFVYDYNRAGQVTGVKLSTQEENGVTKFVAPNFSMNSLIDIFEQYNKEHPEELAWSQIDKSRRPGGITASNDPIRYLGGALISTKEYEGLDDSLKALVQEYGGLTDSAGNAAEAINAEAQAEQNKIAIANKEGNAIKNLSKDYKGLVTNVEQLDKVLQQGGAFDLSVSEHLDKIFGNPFTTDTEGFQNDLNQYAQKNPKKDFTKVKPSDLGYEKSSFTEFSKSLLPLIQGELSDSIEQTLGLTAKSGITGIGTWDQFVKGIPALAEAAKSGSTSTKLDDGTVIKFNGTLEDLVRTLEKIDSVIKANDESNHNFGIRTLMDKYTPMLQMMEGKNFNSTMNRITSSGNAMWKNTLALAGGDINNVGEAEGFIKAYLSGDRSVHGRFDREVYGTRRAKIANGEENLVDTDLNNITLIDKKNAGKVSTRYLAQVGAYVKSREQLRDYAREHNYSYEDFKNSPLGQQYIDESGNLKITEKEFYTLRGGYLQDKDGKWIKSNKANQYGAVIDAGINLINKGSGISELYRMGYTDITAKGKNRGQSHWRYAKDWDTNRAIEDLIASGVSYEDWDESLQTAVEQNIFKVTDSKFNQKAYNLASEKGTAKKGKRQNIKGDLEKKIIAARKAWDSILQKYDQVQLAYGKVMFDGDEETQRALESVLQERLTALKNREKEYLKLTEKYKKKGYKGTEDFEKENIFSEQDLKTKQADSYQLNVATPLEKYKAAADAKDLRERRSEYKSLREQKTEYERQSAIYGKKLADDSGMYTASEKAQFQEFKDHIDKELLNIITARIQEMEAEAGRVEGTNTFNRDGRGIFKKIFDEVNPIQEFKEKQNSANIDKDFEAEKRRKIQADNNEAYSAYNGFNNARYRVWEVDQKLGKETDATRIEYLESEKRALLELQQIAQDTVTTLETKRSDPYWKNILDSQKNRADLGLQVRQNEFLMRQKGGSAPGSGGSSNFLGINKFASMWMMRMGSGMWIYRLISKITQAIQKLVQQATQLDKSMTNLRIVTQANKEDTTNLISTYAKLGKEIGATTQEITNSATEWLRQGYQAAEVTDLITASMYLSKLGMIDSTTATQNLTSAMKGFKIEASEAMSVVDKLTSIDLKAATSAGDIAKGLAQFANLGSLAGVNIDEAAAYVATISDVSQMSGSSAGAALKTIISRYGNVKAGAYNKLNVESENTDTSEKLNDVENVLSKIGISIRDTNLEFRSFSDVLSDIAAKWDSMDTVTQKAIAVAFAGIRQQEAFVTLLQNWDKYEELLDTSKNSKGTAEIKYEAYKESLEASTNRLTAAWEEFANSAELSQFLKVLKDLATNIVEYLPWLVKYLPQVIAAAQNLKIFSGNSWIQKGANWLGDKGFINKNVDTTLTFNKENRKWYNPLGLGIEGENSLLTNTKTGRKIASKERFRASLLRKRADKLESLGETEKAGKLNARADKIDKLANKLDKNSKALEQTTTSVNNNTTASNNNTTAENNNTTAENNNTTASNNNTTAENNNTAADNSNTAAVNSGTTAENSSTTAVNSNTAAVNSNTVAENNSTTAANSGGVSGGDNSGKTTGGASKFQIGAAMASYAINQLTATVSAYSTAGLTHKNVDGEYVNSSEQAHKTGRAISTAFTAAIPFVGSLIGNAIAEKVMQNIDRGRDEAQKATDKANAVLAAVDSTKNYLEIMKANVGSIDPKDVQERKQASESFLSEMYKSENTETRQLLQHYLSEIYGEQVTLNEVMNQYNSENKQSRERAAKALEIAQKKIELRETRAARSAEIYAYQEKVDQAQLNYNATQDGYTKSGITTGDNAHAVGHGIGTGLLAGSGVMAGSMAIGGGIAAASAAAAAAAAGTATTIASVGAALAAIPVFGWIAAGVAATAAAVITGVAAYKSAEAKKEAERAESNKTISDRIREREADQKTLREKISNLESDGHTLTEDEQKQLNNWEKQLEADEELIETLKDYKGYLQEMVDEDNKLKVEEALLEAKSDDQYLMDLNIQQLKKIGITGIYQALAAQLGDSLVGVPIYNSNGDFSQAFINLVTDTLKSDAEISSVLTGEAYTLREAVNTLNPKDQFERKILQNFANAIGTTVDNLSKFVDTLGSLKYSELIMSTADLSTRTNEYADLLNTISTSTGSVSDWMNTIITQYPELIQYLSDTPALMDAIMTKIKELSTQYLTSQWTELASSVEFFKDTISKDINQYVTDNYGEEKAAEIEEILTKNNITTMSGLRTWLNGQDTSQGDSKILADAFNEAGSEYLLTSDVYKQALSNYIEYQTSLLDKQINNLTEQRNALADINKQREYENKLIEAKLKLENASKEKKRIYRAGVGWVYESDQEAVKEAQENLTSVENEKKVSDLDVQIAALESQRDEWSNIWTEKNEELAKTQAESFEKEFDINGNTLKVIDQVKTLTSGVTTPLNVITQALTGKDVRDKDAVMTDLEASWNRYQAAKTAYENGTGSAEAYNSALAEYQSNYTTASNAGYINSDSYNGWSGESGSFGSEESKKVGESSYNDLMEEPLYGWTLSTMYNGKNHGGGESIRNKAWNIKADSSTPISPKDAANIMHDIRKADDDDGWIWTEDSYKSGGYGFASAPLSLQPKDTDADLNDYAARINERHGEAIIVGSHGEDEWAWLHDGMAYRVQAFENKNVKHNDPDAMRWKEEITAAESGTLDLVPSLINEVGTEAIITPSGTITALPSHTGIVPADITKNLWALGEVAPSIMRTMELHMTPDTIGKSTVTSSTDESFNIDNLTMNVSADEGFDADAFVESIKQRVALTRNTKRY